jgi:hypothetical protein
VVTTSATQPSVAQIKAGQNDGGTSAAFADDTASPGTGTETFSVTGLTSGLAYYAHFVHNSTAGDSNRLSSLGVYPGTYRTESDISVSGWSVTGAATHAAARNENSASDSEYSTSPTLSGTAVSSILGMDRSMAAGSYTVRYRCKLSSGTGVAKLTFMDGSNASQGASADIPIDSTFTTYTVSVTLTGAAVRVKEELWV